MLNRCQRPHFMQHCRGLDLRLGDVEASPVRYAAQTYLEHLPAAALHAAVLLLVQHTYPEHVPAAALHAAVQWLV